MSYIDLINRFWLAHEGNLFSCTETALYFYLLKTCNLCGWPDSIKRHNAKIQADLGITYPTLSKARNRLKQTGMIDFKTKAGSCNTSYTFKNILKVSLKDCNEVTTEVSSEVGDEVECEVDSDTSYKRDRDKSIEIRKKKIEKEKKPATTANPETENSDLKHPSLPIRLEEKEKSCDKREKEFYNALVPYVEIYGSLMIRQFYNYWTERNKSRTRMRFEMQQTWDLSRRLSTWENKQKNYEKRTSKGDASARTDDEQLMQNIAAGYERGLQERAKRESGG